MNLPLSFCLNAAPAAFQSSETQTSLLELYTSEGCSSCPPAEKWLTGIKASPGLWKDFVPVAFHVDYWDNLGWRDPWSSNAFSDRERAYARVWRSDSVYTPCFVLNGKEWRAWSRSQSIPVPTGKPGVLRVASADLKTWEVIFTPAMKTEQAYEAHAAFLASGLTSEVKAGENKGRRLEHDFVVTWLTVISLKPSGNKLQAGFELKHGNGLPAGTSAVAVWVTRADQPGPLQAAGGWLSSAP